MRSKATPVSLQFAELRLTGNIVPEAWYTHLRREENRGKGGTTRPFNEAITILSEIVYWYRPTVVRAGEDGTEAGIYSKFKADKLQKSYQNLSDKFGFTKDQVREACRFLVQRGLITIEFRNIVTQSGAVNNVMFVEPVFEEVKRISAPIEGGRHEGNVGPLLTPTPYRKYQTPHTENTRTNTEITTESQRTIPQTPLQDKGASENATRHEAPTPVGSTRKAEEPTSRLRGSDLCVAAQSDPVAQDFLSCCSPGAVWTPPLALAFYRKLRGGKVTPRDIKILKNFLTPPAEGLSLARLLRDLDRKVSDAWNAQRPKEIHTQYYIEEFNREEDTDEICLQRRDLLTTRIKNDDADTDYTIYAPESESDFALKAYALKILDRSIPHKKFIAKYRKEILFDLVASGAMRALFAPPQGIELDDVLRIFFGSSVAELNAALADYRNHLREEAERCGLDPDTVRA